MPSPFPWKRPAALALTAIVAAGCASTQAAAQPGHSVADVRGALGAVGLAGFRTIPRSQILRDKPSHGVNSAKILGGLSFVHLGRHGSVVAITVAVVRDPATIARMEAAIASEDPKGGPSVKHAQAGNVVIFSAAVRPTASDRALLADIPKLVAYLDKH